MLILNNVYKSYTIKKNTVNALININISFGTNGLVFILGTSGSGKSTLLNLIGGLDTPTSGTISINNDKLLLDNSSLEKYRNQYMSFIFQDFNLLPNLTVYENISIVCCEKNNKLRKEKIKEILHKVNLNGYEERYPNELSGGEIQRVAIARALSRNSSIILADEPTGNLNKENSKNICNILKSISSDKLIIVVSHNEDLAHEYADRIIKLEDGGIIDDIIINEINHKNEKFLSNEYCFSKKNILKLSLKNIFEKKIRFMISLVSIILAFSILSLSLVISGFERPYIDAKNIEDNYIEKYLITSNQENVWIYDSSANNIIQYDDFKYIRNGIIKSIDEVIEIGYDLYPNYREIDNESIILPDYYLYNFAEEGKLYYKLTDREVLKQEFNFGSIDQYYIKNTAIVYIAGVYHTYVFGNDDLDIDNPNTEAYDKAKRDKSEKIVFHTKDSLYTNPHSYFNIGNENGWFTLKVSQGYMTSNITGLNTLEINSVLYSSYFNDVEHIINQSEIVPMENEIYLSLNVYNSIFNEKSDIIYYLGEQYFNGDLLRSPVHINETINLQIIENNELNAKLELNNLVIKGIIVGVQDSIVISKEIKKRIDDFTINNSILIKTSSVDDQYAFLKFIYNKYGYFANYYYTERLNSFEDNLSVARFISNIFVVLMILLIVLINTIIISQIVKSKEKENGILRAIGIKKQSILNVYLLQSIFIIVMSFIISLIVGIVFINATNNVLVGKYSSTISLLVFRYQYAMIILLVIVLVNFLISYVSLHKAISRNPIDVIRLK